MRLIFILALTLPFYIHAETVYKTVDEEGNIIFTDRPSKDAETIEVKEAQTLDSPDIPLHESVPARKNEKKGNYTKLIISSPENDETIHDNEGNFTVSVIVEPGLKDDDQLALFLDSNKVLSGKSSQFSLTNIDRGTHKLSVAITSVEGKIISRSDTNEFHLRRTSKIKSDSDSEKVTPPASPPLPRLP